MCGVWKLATPCCPLIWGLVGHVWGTPTAACLLISFNTVAVTASLADHVGQLTNPHVATWQVAIQDVSQHFCKSLAPGPHGLLWTAVEAFGVYDCVGCQLTIGALL